MWDVGRILENFVITSQRRSIYTKFWSVFPTFQVVIILAKLIERKRDFNFNFNSQDLIVNSPL